MDEVVGHPALGRILAVDSNVDALEALANGLAGSDLVTMLLEVARSRADRRSPADVMNQYQRDRFVAPAQIDPVVLARLQLDALEASRPLFEPVTISPLAPLGTHSALGSVHQNNVITTMRLSEVAADTTNSLTLEAAMRRRQLLARDPRSVEPVRLAAVDRVVRAQQFEGPVSFAHFCLYGLVIAGRDIGDRLFEGAALTSMLETMINVIARSAPGARVQIGLTDFDGRFGDVIDRICETITGPTQMCERRPDRGEGRGYYPNVCFKLSVETDELQLEIGDGGIVDWTQSLLQNRKERLAIGGLSLERLAGMGQGRGSGSED
ncbi:MAG: hypothetical protein GY724_22330 [Actinomycetia bacterium]|nr:hypothetical protein [Actinomycetes bacterium]MCP4225271.1 hypothetical protein [Actinomycetes bacterium]MCP5031400.1 hypothetical protein [Actinomycetes bacterium]